MNKVIIDRFVIGTFVALYLAVSVISTIHVVEFFSMSNPYWLAVSLAVAFELGAAASLASLITLDKMNKGLVWALFITITLMQMQGNMYYAFKNITDYKEWSELFNLIEEDVLYQKRILAFVSGAILPLVALGFIKSLVDYIKPDKTQPQSIEQPESELKVDQVEKKTKVDSLEGPVGNNGPNDSTLQPVLIDEPIEEELEIDSVEPKEIIENARDLNQFLNETNPYVGGLINRQPSKRTIGDDNRPTGFIHPDKLNNA
jgi:hypothetical protein